MAITKKNGSVIKVTSKRIEQKNKTVYPRFRLGLVQKKNFLCYISYKIENVFIKDKIVSVLKYSIPRHKSKKYLTKNNLVLTQMKNKVLITSVNQGRLIGRLVN